MFTSSLRFPGDVFADFDELQRQFERVFGLRGDTSSSIRSVARGTFPAVNIGSTPEAVEVFAFAPGIDASTLDVSVDKGLLTIAGERKDMLADGGGDGAGEGAGARAGAAPGAGGDAGQARAAARAGRGDELTVYARERPHGHFRRVIALPEDADPQRVDARYRNGVLKIRIEKREASRPRRIPVADAH